MRALFFLNSFVGGGAERVCLNLAKQLYKFDIESDFVTIYDWKSDYEIPNYIHVFCLKIEACPCRLRDLVMAAPKVNEFLADKEYVLITAHVQPSQRLASMTKIRNKCLYVMHKSRHQAGVKSSWEERMLLWLFLMGKKVVTVSQGIENELRTEYGISAKNMTTIYNPCGMVTMNVRHEGNSPHARSYILFMGRLVEQKNPLLALELYYKGKFYEYYDLIYLGNGPLDEILSRQIVDYDMQNYVFMMGFQKNPEIWLTNATLLLSCSRQEGLPMNLIEALCCKTPVVAADCPYGPSEILIGELAKYLIYPETDFQKSIDIISGALGSYPEITEKYYMKFEDELITKTYLKVWKDNFG